MTRTRCMIPSSGAGRAARTSAVGFSAASVYGDPSRVTSVTGNSVLEDSPVRDWCRTRTGIKAWRITRLSDTAEGKPGETRTSMTAHHQQISLCGLDSIENASRDGTTERPRFELCASEFRAERDPRQGCASLLHQVLLPVFSQLLTRGSQSGLAVSHFTLSVPPSRAVVSHCLRLSTKGFDGKANNKRAWRRKDPLSRRMCEKRIFQTTWLWTTHSKACVSAQRKSRPLG